MARVRKNVWRLKSTDKTLDWYERAITVVKQKAFADPTSWRYQGAIHEYDRDGDPFASPTDILPSKTEQKEFWNQCQHGSWYFLSWHRMYLHHFETMVAAEVKKLGGPSDWALPYWNYSDDADGNARLLPTAFRSPTKADGSTNALFVGTRTNACNAGQQFFTAALDPIFWLHHANIDRLWQVWLDRDASHANPTKTWPTKVKFGFRNVAGQEVTMTSRQVDLPGFFRTNRHWRMALVGLSPNQPLWLVILPLNSAGVRSPSSCAGALRCSDAATARCRPWPRGDFETIPPSDTRSGTSR